MKILVTGVGGQLGHDVMIEGGHRGYEMIGTDLEQMDITDAQIVTSVIRACAPYAVIHCAAYTAVDAAESNRELCKKINVEGTANIAKMCRDMDIPMMYFSTDYVFDGEGEAFRKEDDPKAPLNWYGQTKYDGELYVSALEKYFILRISWVFGSNGANFVKTMIRVGKERGAVSVVDDQVGSPTYTKDLAVLVMDMITTQAYGVYHATNEGVCSWCDFAKAIFKEAGLDVPVTAITSKAYPSAAKRPHNSRMSKEKLSVQGFKRLPSWEDALHRYIFEEAGGVISGAASGFDK